MTLAWLGAALGSPTMLALVWALALALAAAGALTVVWLRRQARRLAQQVQAQHTLLQAQRDRLEIEVAQRTVQLTELTHHLQTAREDERHRLARDLHDELGSLLTSAKLDAARLKARLGDGAPEAQARLAHLVDKLNGGIALGRRIIEDLRPSTLAHLGLVATLEILAGEFAERAGIPVHCALAPVPLSPRAELVLYRVVQEALTNAAKYAQAHQLWLDLGLQGGQVLLSVRDDGAGFDTAQPRRSAFGLLGMRFRVEAEGGTLAVVAAPGQGTRVQVRLPPATAPDNA